MAKVQQKSEKITAFGGIFFVLDKFDSILSSVIDSHLGLRSTLIGYQYSEIIRAIFSVFCCGGDCMEDLNLYLKDVLTERPHTRVPNADTGGTPCEHERNTRKETLEGAQGSSLPCVIPLLSAQTLLASSLVYQSR